MEGLVAKYKAIRAEYEKAHDEMWELREEIYDEAMTESFYEWKSKNKLDKVVGFRFSAQQAPYTSKGGAGVAGLGRMRTKYGETFPVEWTPHVIRFNVDDEIISLGAAHEVAVELKGQSTRKKRAHNVVEELLPEARRAQECADEFVESYKSKIAKLETQQGC